MPRAFIRSFTVRLAYFCCLNSLVILQVEQQRLKFMSDRLVAQTELRKKLGQLLYLNNLAKVRNMYKEKMWRCGIG